MGAISGYIGLLVQLPPALFQLLQSLQRVLAETLPNVGEIEHSVWRSFDSDTGAHLSSGFVDGDLIENYLDLPKHKQSELIKQLRVRVIDCISYSIESTFFSLRMPMESNRKRQWKN